MLTSFVRQATQLLACRAATDTILLSAAAAAATTTPLLRPHRSCSTFAQAMAEALQEANAARTARGPTKKKDGYKPRYDGRAKKRNWVDFRNAEVDEAVIAEKRANFNPADRVKRKKCCLLIGYSGVNYFGMQRNPEMKTIEEDLLAAMLKTNWITEDGYKQAQTIQFQRAARTDKGVSAARQCVSLKLPDAIAVDDINRELPEQIRVFCVRRVTKGFNSKETCCGRTYTYTVPTVAFAHHADAIGDPIAYRCDAAQVDRMRQLLATYVGTHCFHNFTSRKEFIDPSAKRFIVSFECGEPFVEPTHGVELAVLKVKGQSFMLHQIRKMVGLALAVLRGHTDAATIERAFGEPRIDVPMAPGLGLVLDQVHYDRYNERYAADGIHEALTWTAEEPTIQRFNDTFIVPTIVETEVREQSMINWLQTLGLHTYDVRVEGINAKVTAEKTAEKSGETTATTESISSETIAGTTAADSIESCAATPSVAAVVEKESVPVEAEEKRI